MRVGTRADGERARLLGQMEHFVHSPFISVLLWFDREITDLDHAWLLDTTIEWFFHKSRIRGHAAGARSYVEVMIAGSQRELTKSRAEILESALAELARFFPGGGRAKVVKSGILKEARATFSVTPGLDGARPAQATGSAGAVSGGGLDPDGLALDDGGSGAQWASGGRGGVWGKRGGSWCRSCRRPG